MILKKINGMNILIDKKYELILAFYVVYLLKYPQFKDRFYFIETPNIEYVAELKNMIAVDQYSNLIKYIMNFTDCSVPINIAIGMNESYEIDYEKICYKKVVQYMKYGSVEGFAFEIKQLAENIHWDDYFLSQRNFYERLVNEVCLFPDNLDLADLETYYSIAPLNYVFIPSIFINGGFGPSDKRGTYYYNKGFVFNESIHKFIVNPSFLVETLFHEFSHPVVNFLVDKYFKNTYLLKRFYEITLSNNLHPAYQGESNFVLYEYLVRANAYILSKKYFKEEMRNIEKDYMIDYGFSFLPDLVSFTEQNLMHYANYEEFVQKAIPGFLENCIKKGSHKIS